MVSGSPFGEFKESGIGSEYCHETLNMSTHLKSITVQTRVVPSRFAPKVRVFFPLKVVCHFWPIAPLKARMMGLVMNISTLRWPVRMSSEAVIPALTSLAWMRWVGAKSLMSTLAR